MGDGVCVFAINVKVVSCPHLKEKLSRTGEGKQLVAF